MNKKEKQPKPKGDKVKQKAYLPLSEERRNYTKEMVKTIQFQSSSSVYIMYNKKY